MDLRLPWCRKTLLPKSLMPNLQHTQVLRQIRQKEQPWPEGLWNKESQLTDTTSWDESICSRSLVSLQGCATWASLEKGLCWRFALITKTDLAFLLCEWCRQDLLNLHAQKSCWWEVYVHPNKLQKLSLLLSDPQSRDRSTISHAAQKSVLKLLSSTLSWHKYQLVPSQIVLRVKSYQGYMHCPFPEQSLIIMSWGGQGPSMPDQLRAEAALPQSSFLQGFPA